MVITRLCFITEPVGRGVPHYAREGAFVVLPVPLAVPAIALGRGRFVKPMPDLVTVFQPVDPIADFRDQTD